MVGNNGEQDALLSFHGHPRMTQILRCASAASASATGVEVALNTRLSVFANGYNLACNSAFHGAILCQDLTSVKGIQISFTWEWGSPLLFTPIRPPYPYPIRPRSLI